MYKFRAFPIILVAFLILVSCSSKKKGESNVSSTTGWKYNDPDNGGFEVALGAEQKTGPGLVLIEGGRFTMGQVQQDVMYDWNNAPRTVTVSSFYMDETEVRNVDYREYLFWLRRVYKDYPEVFKRALPDTLVWRSPMGFNDPYVQYYFRHPSYNNYPVVGVSWIKANDYCLWRTDRVNEQILIDEGELNPDPNQLNEKNFNTEAYLAGQYEGVVNQLRKALILIRLKDGQLLKTEYCFPLTGCLLRLNGNLQPMRCAAIPMRREFMKEGSIHGTVTMSEMQLQKTGAR